MSIEHKTRTQLVAEAIREKILSGEIKAGDPLIMLRLYKKDLRTNVSIEKYTEDFNLKQKKNSVIHNASSNEWIKYKRRKNEFRAS